MCERTFHKKGGNSTKPGQTMWNLGKKAKHGLKIKEKAEILAHGYFEKRGNQLKRGTLTPLL